MGLGVACCSMEDHIIVLSTIKFLWESKYPKQNGFLMLLIIAKSFELQKKTSVICFTLIPALIESWRFNATGSPDEHGSDCGGLCSWCDENIQHPSKTSPHLLKKKKCGHSSGPVVSRTPLTNSNFGLKPIHCNAIAQLQCRTAVFSMMLIIQWTQAFMKFQISTISLSPVRKSPNPNLTTSQLSTLKTMITVLTSCSIC